MYMYNLISDIIKEVLNGEFDISGQYMDVSELIYM